MLLVLYFSCFCFIPVHLSSFHEASVNSQARSDGLRRNACLGLLSFVFSDAEHLGRVPTQERRNEFKSHKYILKIT